MDIPFVGTSAVAFIAVFSALVFFHELGHFWVARRFGIRVDVFSIGFGPSLWSRKDRHGIEWRISAIPLGGYVKFYGDASGASNQSDELRHMSEAERRDCFHFRPLYQRAAVVAAGPAANFLLALVIFTGMFMAVGQQFSPPVIDQVVEGSRAEKAGFKAGDRVVQVGSREIESFEQLRNQIILNADKPLDVTVRRGGETLVLQAIPATVVEQSSKMGRLGIVNEHPGLIKRGLADAVWYAGVEVRDNVFMILHVVGEMIGGERSVKDLGGPLKIAEVSGSVAQSSLLGLLMLTAALSINLGLINLFPIPVLDGGHLLYYAFEAVRGRPLGERVQEYGFRVGMALVLLLMVVVTWNDLIGMVSRIQS
ncbi:RIP metalloprotease RseP [Emcibacter sp. SYSU 3D8]|uniref:RIP metalloprotease RseP n=1 Tax=Emcibacter sp. SYSU 3D8 TaxID=3133969 RepID=UPI0031FE7E0E